VFAKPTSLARWRLATETAQAKGLFGHLEAGGTLANERVIDAYESPRTTTLYDRTDDDITLSGSRFGQTICARRIAETDYLSDSGYGGPNGGPRVV